MSSIVSVDFESRRLIGTRGEEYQLRRVRRRADSFGRRFSVIFSDAALALATGPDLRPTSWRALMLAFVHLDFDQPHRITQRDWAEELDVTASAMSKALAELVQVGWLDKTKGGEYSLSPTLGWRGTPAQYHRRMRDLVVQAQGELDAMAPER